MEEKEELDLEELAERIIEAVNNRQAGVIREIFETVPNIDFAEALEYVTEVTILIYITVKIPVCQFQRDILVH